MQTNNSVDVASPSSLRTILATMFRGKSSDEIRRAKAAVSRGEFDYLCTAQSARCFAQNGLNQLLVERRESLV